MSMFDGVIEFIAVAETQGFTAAAKRLGVSTSHISRRVSELESRLGLELVARTTRQVKLTELGESYYQSCIDLVNGLDQANESVTSNQIELSGVLRVSAAGEFAESTVVPLLMDFVAQHPKCDLEVHYDTRMINFVEDNFDFAIRFGKLEDSNLIARKLASHEYIAAASPAYIEQFGSPAHPAELEKHSCIVSTYTQWSFIDKNSTPKQSIDVRVKGRIKANSVRTIIHACKSGMGIAYMPRTSFGDTIESGELVPVLDGYWKSRGATWLVYANRRYLPARARLAIEFLMDQLSRDA